MMRLPTRRVYQWDALAAEIKAEGDLNGDEIRAVIIKMAKANGLLWRKERNIRGINECPFDLVLGNAETLEMCAIEIKGDTDNYALLSKQLEHYLYAFGNVFVAVHKKAIPDWLPSTVGVLRVTESAVMSEKDSLAAAALAVSTEYEWEELFKANGLGRTHKNTRQILGIIHDVRNNIIFNRFFAIPKPLGEKGFEKFYPLTDPQRQILMGYSVDYHYKAIQKDIGALERRLKLLKEICRPYEIEDYQQDKFL